VVQSKTHNLHDTKDMEKHLCSEVARVLRMQDNNTTNSAKRLYAIMGATIRMAL